MQILKETISIDKFDTWNDGCAIIPEFWNQVDLKLTEQTARGIYNNSSGTSRMYPVVYTYMSMHYRVDMGRLVQRVLTDLRPSEDDLVNSPAD